MRIENELAQAAMFEGLDDGALSAVAELVSPLTFRNGEILLEEDSPNDALYVLVEGLLEISMPDSPQRFSYIHLRTCSAGDVIGEYSAFDHHLASARVEASTPGRVLRIAASDLDALLERNTVIAARVYRNLIVMMIQRLREKDTELDMLKPFPL